MLSCVFMLYQQSLIRQDRNRGTINLHFFWVKKCKFTAEVIYILLPGRCSLTHVLSKIVYSMSLANMSIFYWEKISKLCGVHFLCVHLILVITQAFCSSHWTHSPCYFRTSVPMITIYVIIVEEVIAKC